MSADKSDNDKLQEMAAWVDAHWECAAADLEAGILNDDGSRVSGANWELGLAAYRERLRGGRWCTCRTEHAMTPAPICYAMTRVRRTESGRPAASIWFRTATPMAASVCCAAKPRARNRGPISAL